MQVLDLGAGRGFNTFPMVRAGSYVTAIDLSEELLSAYARQSTLAGCSCKNLRLLQRDITTIKSYEGPFDLVIAVDILSYLLPTTLRSTMEKIYTCLVERGILIGTLFTAEERHSVRESMEQLGAHFYENGSEFVSSLLQNSGFKIFEIERHDGGVFRFKAQKI